MKKTVITSIALIIALFSITMLAVPPRLYLTWSGSNSDTNAEPQYVSGDMFYVRSTGNLGTPATNWTLVTNVTYEVFQGLNYRIDIPSATDAARYYTVTASNMFGESSFSASVVSRLPSRPANLGVGRF